MGWIQTKRKFERSGYAFLQNSGSYLVGLYLFWFVLSFLSNVSTEVALENAKPPIVTFVQMVIGLFGSFFVLRFRGIPTQFPLSTYFPLAFLHFCGSLFINYGIYRGSIPYTQVVKVI